MTRTSSPWAKDADPAVSVTLPPPPPMPAGPMSTSPRQAEYVRAHEAKSSSGVRWPWVAASVLVGVVVSAVIASVVTYAVSRAGLGAAPTPPSVVTAAPASPKPPQFSSADAAAAKQNLCQAFDMSVRGQEGQGGVRVAGGGVNMPVVLRTINSASVVQNAIVPALPPDVAEAAKRYVTAALNETTAATGDAPVSEVNRLTHICNDAIDALADICGMPH